MNVERKRLKDVNMNSRGLSSPRFFTSANNGLKTESVAYHGHEHVPHDNGGKTTGAQEETGKTASQKDILGTVVRPGVILELQRNKGNFRYQQHAEKEHEEEKENGIEAGRNQECMFTKYERTPEKRIGWRGQTNELVCLTGVQIELGQTQSRKGGKEKSAVGNIAFEGL